MQSATSIRSRAGCFTCRRRKKKCDEVKPVCKGCARNELECLWPGTDGIPSRSQRTRRSLPLPLSGPATAATLSERDPRLGSDTEPPSTATQQTSYDHGAHPQVWRRQTSPQLSQPYFGPRQGRDCVIPPTVSEIRDESPKSVGSRDSSGDQPHEEAGLLSPRSLPTSPHSITADPAEDDAAITQDQLPQAGAEDSAHLAPDQSPDGLPLTISLLPGHGHSSYELLSYYIGRTANSMGNGSTGINPFIAKLIPLSFCSPLILQLILAQSAMHRTALTEVQQTKSLAYRHYARSIGMFRTSISEFIAGQNPNSVVLAAGSLLMCLTEASSVPQRLI